MAERGRPAHQPDDESREKVRMLAMVGTRQEDIARVMGMSVDSLARHYREELDLGKVEAVANVGRTVYQQAIAGNMTAAIFFLKTQGGWKETERKELVVEKSHEEWLAELAGDKAKP